MNYIDIIYSGIIPHNWEQYPNLILCGIHSVDIEDYNNENICKIKFSKITNSYYYVVFRPDIHKWLSDLDRNYKLICISRENFIDNHFRLYSLEETLLMFKLVWM